MVEHGYVKAEHARILCIITGSMPIARKITPITMAMMPAADVDHRGRPGRPY
jgi:hypothetical protein